MNELLGGQRWQSVSAITARGRRRVFPRGPGGRVLSRLTLLALDFNEIEIER